MRTTQEPTSSAAAPAGAPGIPAATGTHPGPGTPNGPGPQSGPGTPNGTGTPNGPGSDGGTAAGTAAAAGLPANARVAPAAEPTRDCAAHRRPGRPRSEQAEQAILDAAIEAVADRGIDGVSCEDVASRAGVGKATLYRRWGGKEDLLIAAFAALRRPLPPPRGESVRADLIAMLEVIAEDAADPRHAQQYALLHAEGERYPRLVALYRERVIEPRRELMRSVLRRGIASGEVRPDADVEIAMLALTGAVMARGKLDTPRPDPAFPTRVVDELLHGLTPR